MRAPQVAALRCRYLRTRRARLPSAVARACSTQPVKSRGCPRRTCAVVARLPPGSVRPFCRSVPPA
eukprot:11823406-Alexandrium_andersonii.AAC.1